MLKYFNKAVSSQAQFDFVSITLSIGLIFEHCLKSIIGSFQSIIGSSLYIILNYHKEKSVILCSNGCIILHIGLALYLAVWMHSRPSYAICLFF